MGDNGTRGENLQQVFPLVLFPMPNAQCPIPSFYVFMSFLIILLSKLNLAGHSQI
ncbi:hypothetical protein COO91_09060 [Nostoc flagelliforme CCNUN1]|uniref:Uncharacterized protein n=1 Tax=Nostoc flagelliforme CCNUN1 TaxID=2038116 RepID=A0A2K8T5H6_9NOSO|nr:hypothetical protein COO91_09060 [Nostoc flagelliforme CCNUN1]